VAYSRLICERIAVREEFRRAERVMIYAGFGAEVSLDALPVLAGDKRFYYPVCLPHRQMAAACPLEETDWEKGAYGIRTPVLERSQICQPEELDLVVVPCTAFDARCRRVGMGAGYYDRFLPRCVRAAKIGAAFSCQRLERCATGEHDWILDAFVTEKEDFN
jgi:5-formyltetrahydrofolate cyclo-ligase